MSSLGVLASLAEDHFLCSICESVFSDPVTTPCGHSFCKMCLSKLWDSNELCHCPVCNKRFYVRPEISTNALIEEISVQIKRRKLEVPVDGDAAAEPWQVKCDICSDVKFKATKSCLVCLTSYCVSHLEPHGRVPSLMRHKLMEPVENLEERVCVEHGKLLDIFCRDEGVYICLLCSELDHKDHDWVLVEEEGALQKGNIEAKTAKIQQMIQDRMEKLTELRDTTKISETHKELNNSDDLFTILMTHVQEMQTKSRANIEEKLRTSQGKDEALIAALQQETAALQRDQLELQELSHSDDHFKVLQTFQALSDRTHHMEDWSRTRVYSDVCVQELRSAMSDLVDTFQAKLKHLTNRELTKMRQYKESVCFDPTTAGCNLVVTEAGKRLKYRKDMSPLFSDDSDVIFDRPMILGTKGFTSGRHYWEVQVGLRNDWDVGLAKETVNRKGRVCLKKENGFFAIGKRGFDYQVHCTPYTGLNLCPRPRNIGVYVDYEEGRVSFYDVTQKLHILSFAGESFTEEIFPYFYLFSKSKKSEPLIISPMYDRELIRAHIRSLGQAKPQSASTGEHRRHRMVPISKEAANKKGVRSESLVRLLDDLSDMASAGPFPTRTSCLDKHLICTICYDTFEDPVTTICGHSFCKQCLDQIFYSNDHKCPLCKADLSIQTPEVNIVLRDIVQQQMALETSDNIFTGSPGEVACDVCTELKMKAEKSCLVCLTSYCLIHLEQHVSTDRLKGHKLVEPVQNLDERACVTHGRPLELYSREQQRCICVLCMEEGHNNVVPTEDEWDEKRAKLRKIKADLKQTVKKRKTKVEEIKAALKSSKEQLENEWWDIEVVFTALIAFVEAAQASALEPLKDRGRVLEEEAKELTEDLEAEISRLQKAIADLDDRIALEDHVLFLQSFPSFQDLDDIDDEVDVKLDTSMSFGTMRKSTTTMLEQIEKELEKLTSIELKRVPEFSVDVKLDPMTAHQRLVLSDDCKEVEDGGEEHEGTDSLERFDVFGSVLGLNRFTAGRSFWEVDVSNKTGWDLGVASSNAKRNGKLSLNPDNGYWVTVHYDEDKYAALKDPPVRLTLTEKPKKVGVFVDYEEGLVSFYNVTAQCHIYSFNGCVFTDELVPYFSPHVKDKRNAAPLIISPGKQKREQSQQCV
ncbi:uncharacterized protein ACBR49_019051 [Aulostomus maculatus]